MTDFWDVDVLVLTLFPHPNQPLFHSLEKKSDWTSGCLPRFRQVVLSPQLGALAATLGGWSGARVAEDQLWLKPPGAGPLLGDGR